VLCAGLVGGHPAYFALGVRFVRAFMDGKEGGRYQG